MRGVCNQRERKRRQIAPAAIAERDTTRRCQQPGVCRRIQSAERSTDFDYDGVDERALFRGAIVRATLLSNSRLLCRTPVYHVSGSSYEPDLTAAHDVGVTVMVHEAVLWSPLVFTYIVPAEVLVLYPASGPVCNGRLEPSAYVGGTQARELIS